MPVAVPVLLANLKPLSLLRLQHGFVPHVPPAGSSERNSRLGVACDRS
ncbi:MAG TPA: hypothetical protein VKH82_12195 [Candidatus Binatia bacterium]|nr:hypothetical protein [Candidatus Binatia bacterium]